ncbi:bsr8311 [Bradyrhizobium diazoefficiens USDA 110]|uniref:Bsr8311 protein n=9 Tax=Bradyrhizobium TaxID=374 RepID=Q89B55_BRADU|nr:hypothetical protein CIT37_14900 [Bradyrhizobium ottawaense]NLS74818.1 hypothetical protein [Bradyrhizobium brasilense]NWL42369.1 hypothetical protein [Bradyrhizobium elkanii]QOZ14381.1 hypothetical protein XI02_04375 [Bradyrhizobium sp. CCBAU 21365]BAC53576.1 bsr8311 [Bradyrhizobium diazoefficiens USDA 110]
MGPLQASRLAPSLHHRACANRGFSADGASSETEIMEDTVATISIFRKTGNNELTGPIRTLAFNVKARPVSHREPSDKGAGLRSCL